MTGAATIHRQVWVSVNAQVDAGIAELIEGLSSIPGLRTIESCEGNSDTAWVCFDTGGDWSGLAAVVFGSLGPRLMEEFSGTVRIEMTISGSGMIKAEMTVDKSVIPAVSRAVKSMALQLNAA